VTLSLPYGLCSIDSLDLYRPILFIAAGTGFAPVNAMIEQSLATADSRTLELYWGARSQSDLYMENKLISWQSHVSRFSYFSLLSDERKQTLVSYVLKNHPHDLNEWQIVLSGPFDMVYSTRDILVAQGMSPNQLFSDAFSFEVKKES
ncbi:MAG: NAD(P)H-flavin reductase, partial [bacterium]|nr:NAD(P)H-flavin reductase [bacterium]